MMNETRISPLRNANSPSAYAVPVRVLRLLCASLVVALASRVAFPLPFTPVPFTLQPLAVLAVGLTLGPVDGALALLAYLVEGASGLPVFSSTGLGGLTQLFGPTGGYLLAYPAVAFLSGGLTRRLQSRLSPFRAAALGCTAATGVLFACGASWLAVEMHLTFSRALLVAVLPFVPGEIIKICAAAGGYRALRPTTPAL
jgi:biotin transport system substrate-specific component